MRETPLLFSGAMVDALRRGRKTQTRRVVSLPSSSALGQWMPSTIGGPGTALPLQACLWHTRTGETLICPYGALGDRLWVKETFYAYGRWETRYDDKKGRDAWHFVDMTKETGHAYRYAADNDTDPFYLGTRRSLTPAWWKRPAIFMPRAVSRLLLEITDVRVERVQEISEADAIAEGIGQYLPPLPAPEGWPTDKRGKWLNTYWYEYRDNQARVNSPTSAIEAYASLWDKINAARGYGWSLNPWAWALSFKVIEGLPATAANDLRHVGAPSTL